MLHCLDRLPAGLEDLAADQLHRVLDGPSFIELPGRREPPLFVSVLLHGNEDTGWEALRGILAKHRDQPLPRALQLFIGNVEAARHGRRRLDGQPDFNRIWGPGDTPYHGMAADLLARLRQRPPYCAVDLHNTSGRNPHYACVNSTAHRYLQLATLFSRIVVYFLQPQGVLSLALAPLCPSVTLECGQPGQARGVEHARGFLEACLHLSELPDHPVAHGDLDLFHTVAVIRVPEAVSFGFGAPGEHDLSLDEDLDGFNFQELPVGTPLGRLRPGVERPMVVTDEQGCDVTDGFLLVEDGEVRTRRPVIPAMLTRNVRIVRQDCVGYLMERYPI